MKERRMGQESHVWKKNARNIQKAVSIRRFCSNRVKTSDKLETWETEKEIKDLQVCVGAGVGGDKKANSITFIILSRVSMKQTRRQFS